MFLLIEYSWICEKKRGEPTNLELGATNESREPLCKYLVAFLNKKLQPLLKAALHAINQKLSHIILHFAFAR